MASRGLQFEHGRNEGIHACDGDGHRDVSVNCFKPVDAGGGIGGGRSEERYVLHHSRRSGCIVSSIEVHLLYIHYLPQASSKAPSNPKAVRRPQETPPDAGVKQSYRTPKGDGKLTSKAIPRSLPKKKSRPPMQCRNAAPLEWASNAEFDFPIDKNNNKHRNMYYMQIPVLMICRISLPSRSVVIASPSLPWA